MALRSWLGLALIVTVGIRFLSFRYIYGLRRFKGPLLASFTDAWRFVYHCRNTGIPFRDLHDRFGDVVRVGPNVLSFRDPQAIRDIFGAGKNWDKVRTIQVRSLRGVPTEILMNVLPLKSDVYFVNAAVSKGEYAHTLFSSTDPNWHKNVRRAMNPFFTQTTVLTYEPFVERTIEVFMAEMDNRFVNRYGTGNVIDFPTWLYYFTFDVMSDLTYSKPHGFITHGEDMHGIIGWVMSFVNYSFIVRSSRVLEFFLLTKLSNLSLQVGQMPWVDMLLRHNLILMWLERRGWYAGNTFPGATFAIQRIQERGQEKLTGNGTDKREDLLDKFRRAKQERPEHITDKAVLGLSLSTMLAGAETRSGPSSLSPSETHLYSYLASEYSAISLTAIFYYVLRTPGCYSKLREELDKHLQPASSATNSTYFQTPFAEARELPYLHACIQEAFRMHPAFGMMPERIVPPSGATICGNFIPGGTLVGCNGWVVQRHEDTFGEDFDTYRPERWLADAERTRGMERAMFQFGAGTHVCLGQHIALMEIYKLVPSLMRTYEVPSPLLHDNLPRREFRTTDYMIDFSC